MPGPDLAVVIPTVGRSRWLADVLADVAAEQGQAAERVVVDQSTGTEAEVTASLAERYGFRRIVQHPPGLPAARNRGVAETTSPVILFLDDDVRLQPGCLAAHRSRYGDPRIGGVVGRIIERVVRPNASGTVNEVGPGGRVITHLEGNEPVQVATLKGANMSFRRQALDQIGGFDEAYCGTAFLEDADASERVRGLGWHLWFEPSAEVQHLSAPTGGVRQGSVLETERWRFENTGYFVRRHRGVVGAARSLPTFAAVAARRAIEWNRPAAGPILLRAWVRGWRRAGGLG